MHQDFAAASFQARTPAMAAQRRALAVPALVLVLAPLLGHLPELAGLISCDPLPELSGLLTGKAHHWLAGGCYVDGNAGMTMQALGHRSAEDWLGGAVPWWNPYAAAGMPLAAEMQPASFFLPFILLLHFSTGLLLMKLAMQILAGFCMRACLREIGLAEAAALTGAVLFQFNGTFAWYGDAPILPLPFLPLMIAGIERSARRAAQARPGGILAVSTGLGFSLLAGFPETAFVNGLLAALWAAVAAMRLPATARLRFCAKLAAGGLIGGAVAAPAVVPFLEYLPHASLLFRAFVRLDQLTGGQAATLALPTVFGPPYADAKFAAWGNSGGYIGAGLLLAGTAGLIAARGHGGKRALAFGWTVVWIAVFAGEPVCRAIWHATPVLNEVAVTRYAMPSLEFVWVVLAALGFEQWRAGQVHARAAAMAVALAACASLGVGFASGRIDPAAGERHLWYPLLTVVWTLGLVGLAVLIMRRPYSRLRATMLAALLAADALLPFELTIATGLTDRPIDMAPIRFLAAQPGFVRSYAMGDKIGPNYGSYFGIATLQSFAVPTPALWSSFAMDLDPRLLGSMLARAGSLSQAQLLAQEKSRFAQAGVGYIVADPAADPVAGLHDPGFRKVFESPAARIYALAGAAPYFEVAGGPCTLRAESRLVVHAACAAPAVLTRRELFFPGWTARVNGAKAPISQNFGMFQAVALPAGPGDIEWRYAPPHFWLILGVFAGGAGGLFLVMARGARRDGSL